ncbi:MAG: hypothetical protein IPK79_12805 [Vampirovibrionales bacterium]|nr:hypothetical protein [Vampirovibrionales bacterium]
MKIPPPSSSSSRQPSPPPIVSVDYLKEITPIQHQAGLLVLSDRLAEELAHKPDAPGLVTVLGGNNTPHDKGPSTVCLGIQKTVDDRLITITPSRLLSKALKMVCWRKAEKPSP